MGYFAGFQCRKTIAEYCLKYNSWCYSILYRCEQYVRNNCVAMRILKYLHREHTYTYVLCNAEWFIVSLWFVVLVFGIWLIKSLPLSCKTIIPWIWLGIITYSSNSTFGKCFGISLQHFSTISPTIFNRILPCIISPKTHSWLCVHMVTKYSHGCESTPWDYGFIKSS